MKRTKQVETLIRTEAKLWDQLDALTKSLLQAADDAAGDQVQVEVEDEDEEEDDENEDEERAEQDDDQTDYLLASAEAEEHLRDRIEFDRYFSTAERYGDFETSIEGDLVASVEDFGPRDETVTQLQRLQRSIARRDIEAARDAFTAVVADIDENPTVWVGGVHAEMEQLLDDLDLFVPQILYRGPHDLIEREGRELLLEITSSISNLVARNPTLLHNMTPREFEEFIAEIFSGFGYLVQLTARTRDGGRDIVAVRRDHGILSKLLIECKRWSVARPIGVSYVRQLYAVKTLEKATKAILATTSHFSKDARKLESQLIYELELKDFNAVTAWARQYSDSLRRVRSGK